MVHARWVVTVVVAVLAAWNVEQTSAAAPFPIGAGSLLTQPALTHKVASAFSFTNGLTSLITLDSVAERTTYLNASIPDAWATDPYKTRLLVDAVQSYLILYAPAVIAAFAVAWPIAPVIAQGPGLAVPAGRGTTPNSDTVYSGSRVELSQGPFELHFPAVSDGRFFSIVVYDVNQNVVASLGSTQGLTSGISLLLAGPSSSPALVDTYQRYRQVIGYPALPGALYTQVVQVPTDIAIVLIRILAKTHDGSDQPNIVAYQQQISILPYNFKFDPTVYGSIAATGGAAPTSPAAVVNATADPAWWYTWGSTIVTAFPAPNFLSQSASSVLNRFGLLDSKFNFSRLDADQKTALTWALPIANRLLSVGQLSNFEYVFPNGWQLTTRNIGIYGTDWFQNAVVAKGYLLANYAADAAYRTTFVDSSGVPLDGSNSSSYSWTIPGGALPYYANKTGWWSLIAYDSQGVLIENSIKRYAVGDRTTGLVYSSNGDLTLTLQYAAPSDPTKLANWLPVSNAPFFLVLRLYNPFPEVLDGKYAPPAVVRQVSGRRMASA